MRDCEECRVQIRYDATQQKTDDTHAVLPLLIIANAAFNTSNAFSCPHWRNTLTGGPSHIGEYQVLFKACVDARSCKALN